MIYGLFDAVNLGGCCYTKNAGMRDIIKLNDQGQEQKEVPFDALHCWKNHRPWLSQKLHATPRGFTFGEIHNFSLQRCGSFD